MNRELERYIEEEIIPKYREFDSAHNESHVRAVIKESLSLSKYYDVNTDMVYTVAAFHDTGLSVVRENHHKVSADIIKNDTNLKKWFSPEQIGIIADAAEDHRASNKSAPRSIYGRIVAEADRLIDAGTIVRRAIRYGIDNYPNLDKEGMFRRFREHMQEKYAEGGYLKLWIPESPNAERLRKFQQELKDDFKVREYFERIYLEETNGSSLG